MLPDYDQRVPPLTHRGVTHTDWFALLVGGVLGVAGAAIGAMNGSILAAHGMGAFGTIVGTVPICSHIAADALTPAGVTPLAPIDDRHISYDVARASNPLANYALLALGGGAAALIVVAAAVLR